MLPFYIYNGKNTITEDEKQQSSKKRNFLALPDKSNLERKVNELFSKELISQDITTELLYYYKKRPYFNLLVLALIIDLKIQENLNFKMSERDFLDAFERNINNTTIRVKIDAILAMKKNDQENMLMVRQELGVYWRILKKME